MYMYIEMCFILIEVSLVSGILRKRAAQNVHVLVQRDLYYARNSGILERYKEQEKDKARVDQREAEMSSASSASLILDSRWTLMCLVVKTAVESCVPMS